MTATLLQMPALDRLILESLFSSHPKPLRLDELVSRTGVYRLRLFQKTLVDLEEQDLIEETYDVGERRSFFSITQAGREHLLSMVLIGRSGVYPLAESEDAGDVSTHLQIPNALGSGRNGGPSVATPTGPLEVHRGDTIQNLERAVKKVQGPTVQDRAGTFLEVIDEYDRLFAPDLRYRADDSELEKFRDKL